MASSSDVSSTVASEVKPGVKELPEPLDFTHHYSETTRHRFPSKMKAFYKVFGVPGLGQLAGGLPNVHFFPFDTLEAQAAKPERWTPTPNHAVPGSKASSTDQLISDLEHLKVNAASIKPASEPATVAKHVTVPKILPDDTDRAKRIDLATALQYGFGQGYPPLLEWVRQFATQHLTPDVPYAGGPDVCLTVGATDGFAKTLELFVDPWSPEKHAIEDRPGLVCETFVYGSILAQSQPKGIQIVPIKADEDGMCADGEGGLADVMANWQPHMGKRPHLYYTVSMGHNPTGIVMSIERRKAIYAVCSKYDIIVVEDDPYWYLQYPSAAAEEAKSRERFGWYADATAMPSARSPAQPLPKTNGKSSGFDFLDSLTPSFLSVDTEGRVVRLDTFSKTVAPGCRLGWITAQPALIERYVRIAETSTQQPSGFVQSIIAELVMGSALNAPASSASRSSSLLSWRSSSPKSSTDFQGWQMSGWVRWLEGLRGMYERRMVRMCRIFDEGAFRVKTSIRNPLYVASSGSFDASAATADADNDSVLITKTRLYDFSYPRGGMFVWIRMFLEHHPLYNAFASDGSHVIDGTALATGLIMFLIRKPFSVAISPGLMFCATDEIREEIGWGWFRICFAAEAEEKIEDCSLRFVKGVHEFWKIKKVAELEDILKDAPQAQAEITTEGMVVEMPDEFGNLGRYMGC